jgi:membrane fusion protein, multidrug efflux system
MSDERRPKSPGLAIRVVLFAMVPSLVLGVAGYFYAQGGRYIITENAYVKADIVQIGTNIDGLVTEVFARENQRIAKGDPLFAIDPRPYEKALAATEADLAAARQKIETLRARYRRGQVSISAAQERIRYLKKSYERQEELLRKGHGTQVRFDEIEYDLNMALRKLGGAREDNQMVLAELSGEPKIPIEDHPIYLRAQAERDIAALNLSYARIASPANGIVTNVNLKPGEYVMKGRALLAIVGTKNLWVEANLKEVDLAYIRVGQKATVVLDSLPDVNWLATVDSISPATGAQFSVLPPQNATGNWVKVVQRVPVRLILADRPGSDALRAGLTATVRIDTKHERNIAALIGKVFARTSDDD